MSKLQAIVSWATFFSMKGKRGKRRKWKGEENGEEKKEKEGNLKSKNVYRDNKAKMFSANRFKC